MPATTELREDDVQAVEIMKRAHDRIRSEIRKAIMARPVPDLIVIGHTDTTGTRAANFALGRTRAMMIRDLLAASGVDRAVISVSSHGETELQVQTPDGTPEPRNRRVEISVR